MTEFPTYLLFLLLVKIGQNGLQASFKLADWSENSVMVLDIYSVAYILEINVSKP